MTARIDVTGPVGGQLAGLMAGLLEAAAGRIEPDADTGEAVHEARKDLKAFRGLLRLLRPVLDEDAWSRLNVGARDAARLLSQARDTQAMLDATGQLAAYYRRSRRAPDLAALRAAVLSGAQEAADPKAVRSASRAVAAHLSPCRDEVAAWSLPDRPEPYLKGLRSTYRNARRALRHGFATRLPADLHEARKRVIHWRYQLDMFTGLWPRVLKGEVRELQDLREDLGQHNDLVLLEGRIQAGADGFAGMSDAPRFLDAILVLRAHRVAVAECRAELLFGDPSGILARRLARCWHVQMRMAEHR